MVHFQPHYQAQGFVILRIIVIRWCDEKERYRGKNGYQASVKALLPLADNCRVLGINTHQEVSLRDQKQVNEHCRNATIRNQSPGRRERVQVEALSNGAKPTEFPNSVKSADEPISLNFADLRKNNSVNL
jgi:hypothetical protein